MDSQEFLQALINQPETLINQTLEIQLQVANSLQTTIELLEILANQSSYPEVVEAAKLHVNLRGEVGNNWSEIAATAIKNAPLEQNDRLVAELLKIAPIPEYLISEWIPGHRLIEGIENPYLAKVDKIKLLERLGKSTIIEERLKAAAHPDTPRETLEILAGDIELPIRIAVKYREDSPDDAIAVIENQHEIGSNWETSSQQLLELAGSRWSWIRQAVARNFCTPVEVLRELVGDGEEKVQLAVARNLATPGEVLDLLVNHGWGEVTKSIAKHANASEEGLVKLLPRYESVIAQRPNLPQGVLAELLNYGDKEEDRYDVFLIEQKNTPGSILEKAVDILENDRELVYCSEDLAKHPNILLSSLKKLSKHENPVIRLAVCENLNTPESLRNKLLDEFINLEEKEYFQHTHYQITTREIWARLAKLETTPEFILQNLVSKINLLDNPKIYRNIAVNIIGNPNTAKYIRDEILEKISLSQNYQIKYPEWDICLALAFNSSIPENEREEYFQQVINDNSQGCKYLAENPNTPSHLLEKIYELGYESEIAGNPSTPPRILGKLAKDRSLRIRHQTFNNPSITSDILVELINSDNPEYRPKRVAKIEYKSYDEWSEFWFKYPSILSIDLYPILLSKELSEENANSEKFLINKYSEIYEFKVYLANNGDKNYILSLAFSSDTPIHILEKLAKDDDVDVRIALAKSNNRPLQILLKLSQDSDVRVRRKLLKHNQITPIEILEILKSDESEEIRNFIANCRKTPPEILIYLSKDSSIQVKQNIADNTNTPIEIIERLWKKEKIFSFSNHNTPSHVVAEKIAITKDSEILCKILDGCLGSFPKVPASSLEKLALHKDDSVRSKVAEHPNTPIHILELLGDDNYRYTRFYLAKNPNTPPHILENLFNIWKFDEEEYNNQLSFLAGNPNTPPTVLDCLLNYGHFFIRAELFKNPNLPISVIEKLLLKGEEPNANILNILFNNPALNHEIVDKLLQSPNAEIRRNTTDIPYVTPEQWIKLARDESSEIREIVAIHSNDSTILHTPPLSITIEHPNLPLEIWEELAKDSSVEVREGLTLNQNTPQKIIELLTSDDSAEIRESLIYHNPNIYLNILEILSRDISPNVRKAVVKHPNTSVTLLEKLALDNHQEISQAIIENPNTPLDLKCNLQNRFRENKNSTLKGITRLYKPEDDLRSLLSEYIESQVPFVRFISLIHPLIPVKFLQQYSQSLLWWERYAVAINYSTPLQIREKLTEDCNCIVKAAAQDYL